MSFTTLALLVAVLAFLSSCSATPKSEDGTLEISDDGSVITTPDGWAYKGVMFENGSMQLIVNKGDEGYMTEPGVYTNFTPTLAGHAFAVDPDGTWWHFASGAPVESMPWTELFKAHEIDLADPQAITGAWPVQLSSGGYAKVDHAGVPIESWPDAVFMQLVDYSWVVEHADGNTDVDAPGGEPLTGGARYLTRGDDYLVYFGAERLVFQPVGTVFKDLSSAPAVKVLATRDGRRLMALVPSFKDDPTVALYDFYSGETRETQQSKIDAHHLIEAATSPHVSAGAEPMHWDVILAFDADNEHWTAYELELGTDASDPKLTKFLTGTGDEPHALQVLEAELISRHSHALAAAPTADTE